MRANDSVNNTHRGCATPSRFQIIFRERVQPIYVDKHARSVPIVHTWIRLEGRERERESRLFNIPRILCATRDFVRQQNIERTCVYVRWDIIVAVYLSVLAWVPRRARVHSRVWELLCAARNVYASYRREDPLLCSSYDLSFIFSAGRSG